MFSWVCWIVLDTLQLKTENTTSYFYMIVFNQSNKDEIVNQEKEREIERERERDRKRQSDREREREIKA